MNQTDPNRRERYCAAIHDAMETDLSLVDQEPAFQALIARAAEAAMALADAELAVPSADQNRQFLTTLANLGITSHRLSQIRDAARLHRQQLIGTNELYAVIDADDSVPPAAASAVVSPPTDRAAEDRVRALHRKATHGDDCVHCAAFGPAYDNTWPCQTIRALDGTLPDAELRRLAVEAHDTGTQQQEPDDTDLTETDIDQMMAAGVPVQIVTQPPDTHGANESSTCHDAATAAGQNLRFAPSQPTDEDVVEAHRLALSEALHLGNGAPWDAILDRAGDLSRRDVEAQQQPDTEAQPPYHRWYTEQLDPVANQWAPGWRFTDRAEAVERYQILSEHGTPAKRRLVRETTTYTVEEPAPVAQQPAALRAELTPFQLLADQPDEQLPQTERVIGGRRLGTTEQQAAAADGEECCGVEPPQDGTWGDCWCTLPPGHTGEHRCQPCTDRHGAPGWAAAP